MSFSIQTNVNSLVAQENLRVNSNFQSQTIQRLTSGYRINSSGDDAAGLAVANKFRSDVAEITQGVRNANDGVAQLQIMDGGMSNISKMLDRLKTLAAQSASDSFTGDRGTLNKEYQTLVGEIDRQAQSIGLATGGHFAKSMGIFIGGGVNAAGSADSANGTVKLDLANSVVDSKALGLRTNGYQVETAAGTDIGAGSATSVAAIAANASNGGTTATFKFSGPNFSNTSISVDIAGLSDPQAVADKLNQAIATAGNSDTNFRAAGITASIDTASDGTKSLVFSSAGEAFQVAAGTKTANALLGTFQTGATTAGEGADVGAVVKGAAMTNAAAAETVTMRVVIDGTNHDFTVSTTAGHTAAGTGAGTLFNDVNTAVDGSGKTLSQLGVTLTNDTGNKLKFSGPGGSSVDVLVSGDKADQLGLGSWQGGFGTSSFATGAGTAVHPAGTAVMELSINGGDKVSIQLTDTSSLNQIATDINNAVQKNTTLTAAGITATANDATHFTLASGGVDFRYNIASASAPTFDLQLGGAANGVGAASSGSLNGVTAQSSRVEASGASETGLGDNNDVFSFKALKNTGDTQTLSFSSTASDGSLAATSITLNTTSGATLDSAITAINAQLQSDSTLKNIVAVKENNAQGTAEGIRFISSQSSFDVKVGNATNFTNANPVGLYDGTAGAASKQGVTVTSSESGTLDISTEAGAQKAVLALGNAITTLGNAQAAIGKGQNQLSYAIGLAQSQINNFSAAQAQIRDADVAAEAANLTKAQVLQQASIAAMAQANSAPQAVLSLLRG